MSMTKPPIASGEIEAELEQSNSTQLKERVRGIVDAARENEKVAYTVTADVHYDGSDLTAVTVAPDTSWTNKGELGDGRAHAVLGPRGGVRTAKIAGTFVHERDYADRKGSYTRFTDAIRRMI